MNEVYLKINSKKHSAIRFQGENKTWKKIKKSWGFFKKHELIIKKLSATRGDGKINNKIVQWLIFRTQLKTFRDDFQVRQSDV